MLLCQPWKLSVSFAHLESAYHSAAAIADALSISVRSSSVVVIFNDDAEALLDEEITADWLADISTSSARKLSVI